MYCTYKSLSSLNNIVKIAETAFRTSSEDNSIHSVHNNVQTFRSDGDVCAINLITSTDHYTEPKKQRILSAEPTGALPCLPVVLGSK